LPVTPSEVSAGIELLKSIIREFTPQYREAAIELRELIKKQTALLSDLLLQFNTFVNLDFENTKELKNWATDYRSKADGNFRNIELEYEEGYLKVNELLDGKLKHFVAGKKVKFQDANKALQSIFGMKEKVYDHLSEIHFCLAERARDVSENKITRKIYDEKREYVLDHLQKIEEILNELKLLDREFAKITR
jgi:hypothetical protein